MRKAAEMRWSGERRGEEREDEGEITRCEATRVYGETEKENIKGKWEGGRRVVNMISLSAAAHSRVELIRSDNRLHWGTVFICCWFGCILMEAERPCYFFFFFLKKEHCVMQRGSLLIEANISTRGAALYLIRIVPVLRLREMRLRRLETGRILIRYGFDGSSSVLDLVCFFCLFVLLLLLLFFFFYCEFTRVIPCLPIWCWAEYHFPNFDMEINGLNIHRAKNISCVTIHCIKIQPVGPST